MHKVAIALIGGIIGITLAGCGGGGGSSSPKTIHGSLSRSDPTSYGHYFDGYQCRARKSGTATVAVSSGSLDVVIAVGDHDGNVITTADDVVTGTETMRFRVESGETYAVLVMGYYSGETGPYTATFSTELKDIQQMSGSAGLAAQFRSSISKILRESAIGGGVKKK